MNRRLHKQIILSAILACCGVLSHGQPNRSHPKASFATLSTQADQARDANRLDEAIGIYRRALGLKPAWQEGWWSLATIFYDQNQYPDAARAFEHLLVLNPRNGTARLMLGLCQYELGDDSSALKNLEEAKTQTIASNLQLFNVMLYHDGILLRRAGKFEGAGKSLREVCAKNPQSEEAITELGMVSLRMRDKHAPASGTQDAEVVQHLGQAGCLIAQKRFDEGRSLGEATVKQYPDYPNIHYAYGRLLLEIRDTASATEEFEQAIKKNPDDVYSRLEIAALKYRIDSAAGLPFAEEAVKLNPQLPFGHYLLGLLLLDTNDYQHAIPELEIAQKSFPAEAKVYFALGTAYTHAGRKDEAARARATFIRLSQAQGDKSKPSYDGQEPSDMSQRNVDSKAHPQSPR